MCKGVKENTCSKKDPSSDIPIAGVYRILSRLLPCPTPLTQNNFLLIVRAYLLSYLDFQALHTLIKVEKYIAPDPELSKDTSFEQQVKFYGEPYFFKKLAAPEREKLEEQLCKRWNRIKKGLGMHALRNPTLRFQLSAHNFFHQLRIKKKKLQMVKDFSLDPLSKKDSQIPSSLLKTYALRFGIPSAFFSLPPSCQTSLLKLFEKCFAKGNLALEDESKSLFRVYRQRYKFWFANQLTVKALQPTMDEERELLHSLFGPKTEGSSNEGRVKKQDFFQAELKEPSSSLSL